jgi:hypothetical protein
MLFTVPLTVGFVLLRWLDAAHRRLARFILAGSSYAARSRVPRGLPIRAGSGYDGQFYYQLALDPFNLARTAFGIRLDSLSRIERVGYPFLAWTLVLGHHADVPLTLVLVNIVAAAVLGLAGGLLAKSAGRHAAWSLVFPLYWGYLWTIGRDLSELTTAAFVVLALAALVRKRPVLAGLAFLGAVVSKETAVLLVGTLAVTGVWLRARDTTTRTLLLSTRSGTTSHGARMFRMPDLAWAIPLGGFALWQLVLVGATGHLPIYKSGGENLGPPLVGFVHGISHYATSLPSVASALWFAELLLMAVLVGSTAQLRRYAPAELQVLWLVAIALGVCAATGVWLGDVGFRSLDDIYLLSWVVLLFHPSRITPFAALCGCAWGVVAVELIHFI